MSGAQEKEMVVDMTAQEKNITHPTETKLTHKIIRRSVSEWSEAAPHHRKAGGGNCGRGRPCRSYKSLSRRPIISKTTVPSIE
ncbi:MAG TPA: hypothetical protein VNN22_12390 [Verrucomicrobiae bacterium]|nr:hypothetical protein [Verrucomicrobiae bacterium]